MSKFMDFLSGGIGGTLAEGAVDIAKGFFPAKLSEEDEKRLAMQMQQHTDNVMLQLGQKASEDQAEFNQRVKDLEGTTSDLKTIPYIGPIIIFLRGMQRPVWGFATLYMDFQWLSGDWTIEDNTQRGTALIVINILVLGFLFGERTLKNLEPLLLKLLK